jgi:hypothetical protein
MFHILHLSYLFITYTSIAIIAISSSGTLTAVVAIPTHDLLQSKKAGDTFHVDMAADPLSMGMAADPLSMGMAVDPLSMDMAVDPFNVDVVFAWKRQPTLDESHMITTHYCTNTHGNKINRFRETGTLEYALHAVKIYLPWVHKIFIVTANEDEVPCWLGKENSDVKVISHKEIWPQSKMMNELPTFNSIAIETHIHRIPNLTEHFIYLNDDMFIGKPLPKSYFFDAKGRPLVSLNPNDKVLGVPNVGKMRSPHYLIGTHGPYVARKSTIELVQTTWTKYFSRTSSSRCRTPQDTQSRYKNAVKPPFWVYNWYGLATNTSVGNVTGVKFMDMHFTPKTFYKKLLTDPPAEFFTLNDDFSPNPVVASAEISRLDRFLTRYYGTFPNSYKKDYSTCDLQIDRGLVDISRTNMSLFADSTLSVHILNDNIQDTLSSVEVGHWDELRPSNLVDAQGRGVDMLRSTDTIRITYFNAERGTQWKNQCAMIRKDSSLKDSPIVFFNELDVDMARSGNVDTAYELAKCLQMNYAYGIEFVELTLGQKKEINLLPRDALNNRSFHGNAILSKYPLRNVEVHQLPGTAEYWRQGGKYAEPRLGERMAIFASIRFLCIRCPTMRMKREVLFGSTWCQHT